MRWQAIALAGLLLLSGCLGGGGEDEDGAAEAQSLDENATNASVANATKNDTYLKNTDYNQTHVHDYWPGETTQQVLMDDTVSTNLMFSAFYTAFSPLFTEPQADVGITWFSLPNNTFVPQGTGLLTVEVDATSALKRGQVQLSYRSADAAAFTALDPQEAQATWEIQVSPDMVDVPHAKSTRWAFVLEADGNGAVLDGEVNVKVIAHKTRELEAWPEHPDFWEQGTLSKLHLFNTNGTFDRATTPFLEFAQGEQAGPPPIAFPEGTIVPPETRVLLVDFWYALDSAPANNVNGDINLLVKEGSSASYYRWAGFDRIQDEVGHKTYALPVDGGNWDSPYTEQSNWGFQIRAPTGVRDPQTGETQILMGIAEVGSGNYTVDVTAYKDVPPWLQEQMEGGDDDDRGARAATTAPDAARATLP